MVCVCVATNATAADAVVSEPQRNGDMMLRVIGGLQRLREERCELVRTVWGCLFCEQVAKFGEFRFLTGK